MQDSSSGNDYDLSTPFSPGVLQYAAMVPANLSSVTLCVQPWQSELHSGPFLLLCLYLWILLRVWDVGRWFCCAWFIDV